MIVITGGAGFIGSNLVRFLNEQGIEDILIVDNLKKAEKHLNLNTLNFSDYMDKYDFYDSMSDIIDEKIEAVIHIGACSDTMEQDGTYIMENNYEFSKNIFELTSQKKIPLIYASSAAVYGMGEKGFGEQREYEYPLNIYAFSKYLFDQYVRKNMHKRDSQVIGLRFFNVYGPGENHKGRMASTAWHFYHQSKNNGVINAFQGSSEFLRDFVFVKDVCKVIGYFLRNEHLSGIFNVGSGKAESFLSMAEIVKNYQEKKSCQKIEISEIPFPEKLVGKYQKFTQADLTALRSAGYDEPMTSLKEGVEIYLDYLQQY